MLSIINQWNRWGSAKLSPGYPREIVNTILPFLDTSEIVALVGLRRAGKSTILYQLMDQLEKQGVPASAMLHMNFEEPSIAPQLSLALLDDMYRTYREQVYPVGKAYIFFDEIQNVPDWERWVRARNETEDIKIFITGSSAQLMSRELATLLTGRHVEFFVSPLSFAEYLQFNNITPPKKQLKIDLNAELQYALNQYMTWGGLPEIVLSQDDDRKQRLLKQYFEDILFKDVAMRHQIRDVVVLRNIAVHLITQTACLCSINRIANIFGISLEMASTYCHYIAESFLVDFVPYFSLKTAERQRNPQKIHVSDLGFRKIASLSTSPDHSKLIETTLYHALKRQHRDDIFYWKKEHEVDFVIRSGNEIASIIQVADQFDDPATLTREIKSLDIAQQKFPHATSKLVAARLPKTKDARIVPLWQELLKD